MQHTLILKFISPVFLAMFFTVFSCAGPSELVSESFVKGKITVDTTIDETGDFSGIEVLIATYREEREDTVFQATTDIAGYFEGKARFDQKSEYVFIVSRNQSRLASTIVILAPNDTLRVEAQLPNFDQTLRISSPENDAYAIYRRLQRQFDRVAAVINSGQLPEEEIEEQVITWANLFWSIRDQHPGTLAASRASSRSIEILDGWNDALVLARISETSNDPNTIDAALFSGKSAMLRTQGLTETVAFLDELQARAQKLQQKILIDINTIELLYDSLRIEEALSRYETFLKTYEATPEIEAWTKSFGFDITYLAPGMPFPEFLITVDGGNPLSHSMLEGRRYIIEFVRFDDRNYQQRFPLLLNFHANLPEDITFVTVPTHNSQVTINAFFMERDRNWQIADAGKYLADELPERLNLDQLPVRFLVDADGTIVRKYYGHSLRQLQNDIERLISQKQEAL